MQGERLPGTDRRGPGRFFPLWIWLAVGLTILAIGTVGLLQRSREGARLGGSGIAVTATVTRETSAGRAVPFGHRRTNIWIWYEYQGTNITVLACGYFDDCRHYGETMPLGGRLTRTPARDGTGDFFGVNDQESVNWRDAACHLEKRSRSVQRRRLACHVEAIGVFVARDEAAR